MNAAGCSWRVSTSLIFERRSASTMSRFSSPGTPKICWTPSFSSAATKSSAPFMVVFPSFILRASFQISNSSRRLSQDIDPKRTIRGRLCRTSGPERLGFGIQADEQGCHETEKGADQAAVGARHRAHPKLFGDLRVHSLGDGHQGL